MQRGDFEEKESWEQNVINLYSKKYRKYNLNASNDIFLNFIKYHGLNSVTKKKKKKKKQLQKVEKTHSASL